MVDATVSVSALITGLFQKLPAAGHELVLFDINRINEAEKFFTADPQPYLASMLNKGELQYTVTLITNQNETSRQVHVLSKEAVTADITASPLGIAWPKAMHSLSHVALPFPKADPLYGENNSEENPGAHLGNIALQGETGVLSIPASAMLRLRWNPFYSYLEQRIFDFVSLEKE